MMVETVGLTYKRLTSEVLWACGEVSVGAAGFGGLKNRMLDHVYECRKAYS
ncbi:MAG: hypothetical protein ACM359_04170 [Bacillota bacterium]